MTPLPATFWSVALLTTAVTALSTQYDSSLPSQVKNHHHWDRRVRLERACFCDSKGVNDNATATSGFNKEPHNLLTRFYRAHQSRMPRLKPGDVQYSYTHAVRQANESSESRAVIATLRLCHRNAANQSRVLPASQTSTGKNSDSYIFLRALCVATPYRRQGWALQLLQQSLAMEDSRCYQQTRRCLPPVYLFADPVLEPLYSQAGFVRVMINQKHDDDDDRDPALPRPLQQRYASINRRLAPRNQQVICFVRNHDTLCSTSRASNNAAIHIWLLQHHKEIGRPTGTASLVYPAIGDAAAWEVSRSTWHGRTDNAAVETQIQCLHRRVNPVVLLWTGGSTNVTHWLSNADAAAKSTAATRTTAAMPACTFLLLDGTWQEAQTRFRKISALHPLPRLTIQAVSGPSQYRLRGDYGWRRKFVVTPTANHRNTNNVKIRLLCTVEVVAEVLGRAGYTAQRQILLERLHHRQGTGQ